MTETLTDRQDDQSGDAVVTANAVIAIDGPAGSGKSTTARALADHFNLTYIDTGAMYRALTWAAKSQNVGPDDAEGLADLLKNSRIELRPGRKEAQVLLNGYDISSEIRSHEIEENVSAVAAHAVVRRAMVERQRQFGRRGGVVMEGRDIGSVVFPLATAKVYLDASLEVRARRRMLQFRQRGQEADFDTVRAELADRDRLDSERQESPLRISPDADVLDTAGWNLQEQLDRTVRSVRRQALLARPVKPLPDSPSGRIPLKYHVAFAFFKGTARFFGTKVYGRENLDQRRGVVIASNHVGYLDPPIVGAALDIGSVHTIAKEELFKIWPFGPFFRFFDAVPIKRSGYDRDAFKYVIRALTEDKNVLIFPEGTRRTIKRPGPVRSGLGIILQKTQAPVVPVFVRGTCGLKPLGNPKSPAEVNFAPPIRLYGLNALRRTLDERKITKRIAGLFQLVYEEMQARSFARIPQTEWEIEAGETLERKYRAKNERIFGRGKRARST